MKLLLDSNNMINYDGIEKNTTVKDVLNAVDIFLRSNPLPCDQCDESCCKKSWSVEMDNVCVNKLSNWNDEAASKFVKNKLVKRKNYYRDFYQYVLKKETCCSYITEDNFCTIYEFRPVICRLYICGNKSYRYNTLRELIGSTYLKALVLEDRNRNNDFTDRTISKYRRNPAFFAGDYDIQLDAIIDYAYEEGWLDTDEKEELYRKL